VKVFVAICHDRHVDDGITVHTTRAGADAKVEEFRSRYDAVDYQWTERNYGRDIGWIRYLESNGGDGPSARIQEMELQP